MKILKFLNENALVSSLIVLLISTIIQIIFRKNDKKNEKVKEQRQEFLNKAEFSVVEKKWDFKETPDICLFMTDFKTIIDKNKNIEFHYSENILDKRKYKHMRFYLKNTGEANINQLDICVTSQRHNMLCDIELVNYIVEKNAINYSYCYDRKITKEGVILIDIAYLEDSNIFNSYSSELALLFKDSYGNIYEQPFFIQNRNIYEPYKISNKEYRERITTDKAYECFGKPWMW